MKSSINTKEKPKPEKPFPKLMIGLLTGNIILATGKDMYEPLLVGFVVHCNDKSYTMGYRGSNWSMNSFKDFEGEVILSND
jgi:hypothetical protein